MNLREKKLPETYKGYLTEELVEAWEKMVHGKKRYVPEETQKVVWDLVKEQLPEPYQGWNTAELLDLWELILTETHEEYKARPKSPREKISAMRDLLREYKLTPIHQE